MFSKIILYCTVFTLISGNAYSESCLRLANEINNRLELMTALVLSKSVFDDQKIIIALDEKAKEQLQQITHLDQLRGECISDGSVRNGGIEINYEQSENLITISGE